MKKIIGLVLILILLLGGCAAKETPKTEDELKAEIRAEMEAEAKKEAENTDSSMDEIQVPSALIDIRDQTVLMDFIKTLYPNVENYPEMFVKYHDFTQDGIEDVVCYFDYRFEIAKPIFITVGAEGLQVVSNDLAFQYTQDVTFDETFIYYTITGGGSGIADEVMEICVFDGEKIVKTGAVLEIKGHSAGQGFSVERVGETTFLKSDKDYSHFSHVERQTGSETYEIRKEYTYVPEEYKFEIVEITSDQVSDDSVSSNENIKTEYDVSLVQFKNETLFSEDETFDIDYSKYSLVLIPSQVSVNSKGLETRTIDVTSTGNESEYTFTVLGKMIGAKIIYMENGLDPECKPVETTISDDLENVVVTLNAALPYDGSYIAVEGLYQYQSGIEGPIGVSFDDMRDPTSLKIATVDGYSFPNEDY